MTWSVFSKTERPVIQKYQAGLMHTFSKDKTKTKKIQNNTTAKKVTPKPCSLRRILPKICNVDTSCLKLKEEVPADQPEKSAENDFLTRFYYQNKELIRKIKNGNVVALPMSGSDHTNPEFVDTLNDARKFVQEKPFRSYCCDAIGLYIEEQSQSVVRLQNREQFLNLSRIEKQKLVIVIFGTNAAGRFLPPLLIFPGGDKMEDVFMKRLPQGSVCLFDECGYVSEEIFIEWLNLFMTSSRTCCRIPTLLMVPEGKLITIEASASKIAIRNNVKIISLPMVSDSKIDPLEKPFFESLIVAYQEQVESFFNLGPLYYDISYSNIVYMLSEAYKAVVGNEFQRCAAIAEESFEVSGLTPTKQLNRKSFNIHDYLQARQFVCTQKTEIPVFFEHEKPEIIPPFKKIYIGSTHVNQCDVNQIIDDSKNETEMIIGI